MLGGNCRLSACYDGSNVSTDWDAVAPALPRAARDDAPDAATPDGLRDRDWQVLVEIARGDDARVGFQGLKRRLNLHPQALRRSLLRLVEQGHVVKADLGYALTENGHTLVSRHAPAREEVRPLPVAFLLLPSHVDAPALVRTLARRWFDGLRWYGLSEGAGETSLTWLAPDGSPVRVRINMGHVRLEAAAGPDPDARLAAAAPLLHAVADLLRTPREIRAPTHAPTMDAADYAA